MADTLYLPDGSYEIIPCPEKAEEVFEDIVQRFLGDDLLNLYRDLAESFYDKNHDLAVELDSYSESLHEYSTAMQDSLEVLEKLMFEVRDCKRLDRSKIVKTLCGVMNALNNVL